MPDGSSHYEVLKRYRGIHGSFGIAASYFADNISIKFHVSLVVVDQMMVFYWVCASCR